MDFSRQCLLKTVKSVTMMTHTKLLDVHLQQWMDSYVFFNPVFL